MFLEYFLSILFTLPSITFGSSLLDLRFKHLSSVPSKIQVPAELRTLILSNNRIRTIDKSAFENLTNLETLKLAKNRLTSLPKDLFKNLHSLKKLDLNRNQLKRIAGLTFYGLENLRILKIMRNELIELQDAAFWEFKNIHMIQLDYNKLTRIRKGWLYGLETLKRLKISHNNINGIEGDGWSFCPDLWELDLSHNNLTFVTRNTLNHLRNLQYLYLDHNDISFVQEGAFGALSSLERLDLRHNKISWVAEDSDDPFSGLAKLETLFLSHNYIKSISKRAFTSLTELKVLDLTNNPITTIEDGAFASFALKELRFNSTQLLCDCNIKWLLEWFLQLNNNQTNGGYTIFHKAYCKHPERLINHPLFSVPLNDFTCNDFPKPYIVREPETKIALKGSNYTLHCTAASTSPAPMSFIWRKDNVQFDLKDSKNEQETFANSLNSSITQYTSSLHIIHAQDEDSGKYQCVISNSFATVYSQKATITVNVLPVFIKSPANVTVKAGQTARLVCAAKGHPTPEIAWKKDGGDDFPAATERRLHVMPSDDVFFIVEAKSSDSGVYSCTAKNIAGTVVSNATMVVLQMPAFTREMRDKETLVGETAVLHCMASGSPKPNIVWTKDGGQLRTTERHFFTAANQLLIIVKTERSDEGEYACEMNNTVGSVKGISHLMIKTDADMGLADVLLGAGGGDRKTVIFGSPDCGFRCIFNDHQTLGIIIIAVVCCVIITSLVWVMVIYKTRKMREDEYSPANTEESRLHTDYEAIPPLLKSSASLPNVFEDPKSSPGSGRDSGTGDSDGRRPGSVEEHLIHGEDARSDSDVSSPSTIRHSIARVIVNPFSHQSPYSSCQSTPKRSSSLDVVFKNPHAAASGLRQE